MSCADCHDPHGGTAGHNLRVVRPFAPLTAEEKTALVAKTANIKGPRLGYYKEPPGGPAASPIGPALSLYG